MEPVRIAAAGLAGTLFPPARGGAPLVVTHLEAEEGAALLAQPGLPPCALLCAAADWDRDLSPWPAPRAFRGGADFGGGAAAHLSALRALTAAAEAALPAPPARRCVAGYSLDGLFALWAVFQTADWDRAASVSGSLWYDGFAAYLEKAVLPRVPERVYFSLGDREAQTKNARLARVEQCTAEAERLLARTGAETVFEHNAGGHFADVPARMARALRWLLR